MFQKKLSFHADTFCLLVLFTPLFDYKCLSSRNNAATAMDNVFIWRAIFW